MEEVKVEVPAKFKDIVAGVEKLTLIELHELVKLLEAKKKNLKKLKSILRI